jgi:toxin ParE1/3/4
VLRLELSDVADADLTDILRYGCATFGVDVGEAYFLSFDATFERLCEYPEMHPVSEQFAGGVRTCRHRSHRIFYRVEADCLIIGRVFHVAREIETGLPLD